jgi:lipopolysaccharide transport system ATP-binding protein
LAGITRADGTAVYGVSSEIDSVKADKIDAHRYRYRLIFDPIILQPGSYILRVHAMDTEALRYFDTMERGLTVVGDSREFGLVRLPHRWSE